MKKTYHLVFTIIFFFVLMPPARFSPAMEGKSSEDVRLPAVAGTFYPGSPSQLSSTLTAFLDAVPEIKPVGKIVAAIAPHAGYVFSGGVAAYTHKLLAAVKFDTIVIIGHDTYRDAVAFTCPSDYFQTPLGNVPVDQEMIRKMIEFNQGIKQDRLVHSRDHTIEVQLPFLQVLGKQFKLVPILFGNPTPENCRILTDAILAAAGGKSIFVLASTDMCHYPPYEGACKVDNETLEVLKALDVDRLLGYLKKLERHPPVPNLRTAMCASGGVGTAILFAKANGADHVQILRYANSGDIPEAGKSRVVGYSAVLMANTSDQISK